MNNTEYYVKSQLFNIVEDSVEFDMNDEVFLILYLIGIQNWG